MDGMIKIILILPVWAAASRLSPSCPPVLQRMEFATVQKWPLRDSEPGHLSAQDPKCCEGYLQVDRILVDIWPDKTCFLGLIADSRRHSARSLIGR